MCAILSSGAIGFCGGSRFMLVWAAGLLFSSLFVLTVVVLIVLFARPEFLNTNTSMLESCVVSQV